MIKFKDIDPRIFLTFFVLWTTILLFAGVCLASGVAEGADRTGDIIDLGKRIMNFALLVIILFWVVKKSGIKDFFSDRTREIRQRLDELEREKEEAENRFRDAEERLREFEKQKKDILDQFKREGITEKDKIIEEARDRVKVIIQQAEVTIKQEMQSARERIKQEVVNLAAQEAQKIISSEMTDKDQDHLVHEFIERVGKLH